MERVFKIIDIGFSESFCDASVWNAESIWLIDWFARPFEALPESEGEGWE